MSIYIKGIKSPKDCRECAFIKYSSISGTTYCGVTGDVLAVDFRPIPFEGISENCPIVEVTSHGKGIVNRLEKGRWYAVRMTEKEEEQEWIAQTSIERSCMIDIEPLITCKKCKHYTIHK